MILDSIFTKIGGSIYLRIPPAVVEHLEIKDGDAGEIEDKNGNKGKFIAAWKTETRK
jgi:antitoxin component of MazEF toxin-antitoxin module